jgi:hypothetical protein
MIIIDPASPDGKPLPHPQTRPSPSEENDQLRLNPGAPSRKPRSAGKFCLWLTVFVVGVVGGTAAYSFISNVVYSIQHPHNRMYYDKSEKDIADWSAVVQPMIREKDKFDIIASVWLRDDEGTDGGIWVDGEERRERLLYTGTVFRDMSLKSMHKFSEVKFQLPTKHL